MNLVGGYRCELVFPADDFILRIEPVSGLPLPEWLVENRSFVEQSMLAHGGILFQGFDLSPESFRSAADQICPRPPMPYTGGISPRDTYSEGLYVSTRRPKQVRIPLHHEYSYFPFWPMKIFFYCHTPAAQGGRTTLASTRSFMRALDPQLLEAVHRRRICYVRNYFESCDARWQNAFATSDRDEVERFCTRSGVKFSWHADGGLTTENVAQGMARHPDTGELLWHNHLHIFAMYHDRNGHLSPILAQYEKTLRPEAFARVLELAPKDMPTNAFFGDGGALDPAMVERVQEALQGVEVSFPWHKGDFLALDNMLAFHGRSPFEGERLVLAILKDLHYGSDGPPPGSSPPASG